MRTCESRPFCDEKFIMKEFIVLLLVLVYYIFSLIYDLFFTL